MIRIHPMIHGGKDGSASVGEQARTNADDRNNSHVLARRGKCSQVSSRTMRKQIAYKKNHHLNCG